MAAGYAIVGLAVLGGFVLSFHPQTFGLRGTNPAVGIGLATLAGLRLWALRRELNRQAHDKEMPA